MKNILLKSRFVIVVIIVFVLLTTSYAQIVNHVSAGYNGITIVLDAGHGGRDGGSVGVNGTIEKEINLEYTMLLKNKLVNAGYKVVLTRKNDDGLYNELATNKKQSDMNKRMEIIKKANPNLVVSIHMNSFALSSAKGAVTYHKQNDEASKECADLIQKALNQECEARFKESKVGDFYMLNCSYYTSVLIECGFLSNSEEERLLNTQEYKDKVTDAIFKGIVLYFG